MTFAAPGWLWALGLAPLLLLAQLVGDRRAAVRLSRLLGGRAAEHVEGRRPAWRRWRRGLLLVAVAAAALGLARPQWGAREVVLRERGFDLVVALDVSASMRSQDVPPSRLARARAVLADLLAELRGARVGLVLFAGAAFVQCPLTADLATAELFLRMADTEMISEQGTNIAAALAAARKLLGASGGPSGGRRAVVLVTDGEDLEGGWEAEAELCLKEGIMIVAAGVGSLEGGLIPALDERGRPAGFLKDESGAVVLSRLDPAALTELGRLTGGRAILLEDPASPQRIAAALSGLSEREQEERRVAARQERHHWAYGLALAALAVREVLRLGRRRRRIPMAPAGARGAAGAAAMLLLILAVAPPATAGLLRPPGAAEAGAGQRHLRAGRPQEALAAFESARAAAPRNGRLSLAVGTALAELGRHAEAAREFERAHDLGRRPADRAEALFAAGTELLAAGEPEAAAERLRRSLAIEPAREDALRNLEAALQAMQRQGEPSEGDGPPQEGEQDRQDGQDRQGKGESPRDEQGQQQQGQEGRSPGSPSEGAGSEQAPPESRQGADERSEAAGGERGRREEAPGEPGVAEGEAAGGEAGEPGMSRARALEVLRGLDRDEEQLRRSVQKRLRGSGSGSGRKW